MITAYTDGSSKGNPGPGGYAAVVSYKKTVDSEEQNWTTEIGGKENHTTNNRMELKAAIEALRYIDDAFPSPAKGEVSEGRRGSVSKPLPNLPLSGEEDKKICLITDSKYVMMGITEWIHNWQKKGWKTAGKKQVLNQNLWQELLAVTEEVKSAGWRIEWKYVEGHAGHKLNERADEIATSFADGINPALYDGPKDKYK